jgi:hypothetical protein
MRFFESDIEFTVPIGLDQCRKRLAAMHAKVREYKPSFIQKKPRIGFQWYGKTRSFFNLLLKGPALVGSLVSSEQVTVVKANYYPRIDPLIFSIETLLIGAILLKYVLTEHLPVLLFLVLYCPLILIIGINWFLYFFIKRRCEKLEVGLKEALLCPDFYKVENKWRDIEERNFIPLLLFLLAILIPLCLFLVLPKIVIIK